VIRALPILITTRRARGKPLRIASNLRSSVLGRNLGPLLDVFGAPLGDFTAGSEATLLSVAGAVLAPTICYEVTMPQPLIPTLVVQHPSCELSHDGAAAANLSGGTPPFSYLWEGPDDFVSTAANPANLAQGEHTVTFTDVNGCEAELVFSLTALNDIQVDLGPAQTLCTDENVLLFAPPGYNYLWQDGSINQFFYAQGAEFGEGEHTFFVEVSNPEGCHAIDAVVINFEQCTSIAEASELGFTFYPNPTQGQLRVSIAQEGLLYVFDAQARLSAEFRLIPGWSELDFSNLANGPYLLLLTDRTGQRLATERLIKQ
jgi:hypothetical protein